MSDVDALNGENQPHMKAVERATRKSLAALRKDGRLTADAEALASLAVVLARDIDENGGDAALARELRLVLDTIRRREKDHAGDAFEEWAGELSAPVGDPEIS